MADDLTYTGDVHDFDFLVGRWNVQHRRLKGRLVGSSEWDEFKGTSELWPTLGGAGTADDNVLELPSGTYRAVGITAPHDMTRIAVAKHLRLLEEAGLVVSRRRGREKLH